MIGCMSKFDWSDLNGRLLRLLVAAMAVFAIRMSLQAIRNPKPTVKESPYQATQPGVDYAAVH